MSSKGSNQFAAFYFPKLDGSVRTRRRNHPTVWTERQAPRDLEMTFQSLWWPWVFRVPEFHCTIKTSAGDHFPVWAPGNPNAVAAFLIVAKCSGNGAAFVIPDPDRTILTPGDE